MLARFAALLGPGRAHVLRRYLALCVGAAFVEAVTLSLVVPVLRHLIGDNPASALPWLVALTAGVCLSWVVQHLATARGFELGLDLLSTVRHRVGDHVVTLPLGWFAGANTGRLGHTISTGVMEVVGLPAHHLGPLVRATVAPVVLVAATAVFEPLLTFVVAALLPLVVGSYWWAGRLGRRADEAVQATSAAATDRLVEFAQQQAVLRACGRAQEGFAQLDRALSDLARAERRQLWMVLPPGLVNGLAARLLFLALLTAATALATQADSRTGVVTVVALLVLVNRIVEPLSDVAAHGTGIRMASAQLAVVESVLAAEPLSPPASPVPTPVLSDIELRGVSFAYTPGELVLDDVSLKIPEGTMTALVGASGSGKTTLARLLARFWDTTDGAVLIGGVDVRALRSDQLMSVIAPVFQNTYLFSGSLVENIRIARPDADDADVHAAADLARVTEIVDRLPEGWQTQVGEGGARLSGGERQRVAIARALVKGAPILLLDEVTGALDATNQAAVTHGLMSLRGRHTMLVIAHQLATVVGADQVVVLDGGRVVEHGGHHELLTMNGRYAEFWRSRTAAEGWRLVTR